MNLNSR